MVSRKKRKAARENVQKARHVQAAQKNNENNSEQASVGEDEDYQPSIKQPRTFHNQGSMCFMMIGIFSSFLSQHTICGACRQGTLDIDVTQYNKLNAHVVVECDFCGKKRRFWTAPKNFNGAALMAAKYSGIKTGQLESFGRLTNMGYTNNNGKQFSVNLFEESTQELNRNQNIQLVEMKEVDEHKILETLLADQKAELELAADGMYPIRTNSGACVSSIMAKVHGQWKIIGNKTKNGKFLFTVFFEKHSFSRN